MSFLSNRLRFGSAANNEADRPEALYVLDKKVGVQAVIPEWPATIPCDTIGKGLH